MAGNNVGCATVKNSVKNKLVAALTATVSVWILSGSLHAHHSAAIYDIAHPITLKGTVTKFSFTNPHMQVHFKVKDEQGNVEQWIVQSAPPQRLYRAGWNAKSLKPGDKITVTGAPAKDGSKIMNNRKLVGPKGKVLLEGAD